MREILFKGRPVDATSWIEGDLLQYSNRAYIWVTDPSDGGKWNYEVDPDTIGQYIGKEDEHGKKIFGGDVVYTYDNLYGYEFEGVVVYQNASFAIQSKDKMTHYRWMDYEVEVIGNAHDGKERDNG